MNSPSSNPASLHISAPDSLPALSARWSVTVPHLPRKKNSGRPTCGFVPEVSLNRNAYCECAWVVAYAVETARPPCWNPRGPLN